LHLCRKDVATTPEEPQRDQSLLQMNWVRRNDEYDAPQNSAIAVDGSLLPSTDLF